MRLPTTLLALALASGCITTIDEHTSPAGEVTRDCVVPPPPGVAALDAPVALEYPDRSLWLWEALPRTAGGEVAAPAAWVASVDEACARGPALWVDGAGAPRSVLALTSAEQAANSAAGASPTRTCCGPWSASR
ncbi:MAG: hypothetical protein IPL61_36130 [Myxococcales bacterium]|nr:hypothetical protein [Myxococcales bacterium]